MQTTVAIIKEGRYYNVTNPLVLEQQELDGTIVYVPQEEVVAKEIPNCKYAPVAFNETVSIAQQLFAMRKLDTSYVTEVYDIANSYHIIFRNTPEFHQLGDFVYLTDNKSSDSTFYCYKMVGNKYLNSKRYKFAAKLYRNELFIFKIDKEKRYVIEYRTSSIDEWICFQTSPLLHLDALQIFTGPNQERFFVDTSIDTTYYSNGKVVS